MPRPPRKRSSPRAFTLAELIVLILVLAITAAVVVPHVSGMSAFQAMSAARAIAADLEYAQNVAVSAQQDVTVTFDTAQESYALTNASGLLEHPIEKSDFQVAFGSTEGFEKLDIVSADFNGGAAVTFDTLGSPDNGGTILLQAGPRRYRVTVGAGTGSVKVELLEP
jgi:type II secretory pathway pseudopilin PulG